MPQVNSPHIWYPSGYPGPAYNLYHVQDWAPHPSQATQTLVRFVGQPDQTVPVDTAAFEAAMVAHLA